MKQLALRFLVPTLLLAAPASLKASPCAHRTVHITGTIRDRDGSILRGARVTYHALTWNKDCAQGVWKDYKTRTDAHGLYSVTGPEQGKLLVVHPNRPNYLPELALKEDSRTGNVDADYQLHMFRLRGRVVGQDSLDAEGITVQYCRGGGSDLVFGLNKRITTPRFDLFLPRDEPYVFLVTKPGMKEFQSFSVTLRNDTTITYSLKPE